MNNKQTRISVGEKKQIDCLVDLVDSVRNDQALI